MREQVENDGSKSQAESELIDNTENILKELLMVGKYTESL